MSMSDPFTEARNMIRDSAMLLCSLAGAGFSLPLKCSCTRKPSLLILTNFLISLRIPSMHIGLSTDPDLSALLRMSSLPLMQPRLLGCIGISLKHTAKGLTRTFEWRHSSSAACVTAKTNAAMKEPARMERASAHMVHSEHVSSSCFPASY